MSYEVRRYRPRIEGLFARIERWTLAPTPHDVFWRSISSDNVTTWYGAHDESRHRRSRRPTRIFSWLICESHDDKGNAIVYRYKAEDRGDDLETSISPLHTSATADGRAAAANRYLKRIRYGNRTPLLDARTDGPAAWPQAQLASAGWMFEVVFDYGEHDADDADAGRRGQPGLAATTRSPPTAPASRSAPTACASAC